LIQAEMEGIVSQPEDIGQQEETRQETGNAHNKKDRANAALVLKDRFETNIPVCSR